MLKDPKNKEAVKKSLEDAKKGMGAEQAQKIDDALKQAEKNLAKNDGNPGNDPQPKKDELKQLANDLNSKDPEKQKAAQDKLEQMLKDPKNKEAVKKSLEDAKKGMGAEQAQKIDDALKQAEKNLAKKQGDVPPLKKEDLERLAKAINEKDAAKFKKDLEEMLKDPQKRDAIKKELEKLKNEADKMKDGQAKEGVEKAIEKAKELVNQMDKKTGPKGTDLSKHDGKNTGGNTTEEAPDTALAEMKKKAKAGDLLLERFEKNMDNKEFQKKLGWDEKQMKAFMEKYRKQIDDLKNKIELSEKGELPMPPLAGPSALQNGPERIKVDERDNGGKPLQGGKLVAPPGFADPYKRFTEEVSGVRNAPPKK